MTEKVNKATQKLTNKEINQFIQSVNQEDAELLMTPWFILEVVAFCPQILEHTPLQNDKTFVLEAYKQHPQILHFVGKSLKEDPAFWLEILEKCKGGLQFLPKTFLGDKNFILKARKHFTQDYNKIDSRLWKNAEFCLEMFKTRFQTTAKFSSELWQNKEFVLAILAEDPLEVDHIAKELWTDVEFCKKALIRSGEVAEIIRDKMTEVQAADEKFWRNLLSLPKEVDPGRLIPLLEKIPQQLREKEDFMTYVAQQVPGAETFAGPELQKSATFQQAVADLYQLRA